MSSNVNAYQYMHTYDEIDHPQAAKNYLLNCLSVALQSGNGNVAQIGILRKQQIRMMKDRRYVEENRIRRFSNMAALCDTSEDESDDDQHNSNSDVYVQGIEISDNESLDNDSVCSDAQTVIATPPPI